MKPLSLLKGSSMVLKGFLAKSLQQLRLSSSDRPFCFGFYRCFSSDGLCSSCKWRDECLSECLEL